MPGSAMEQIVERRSSSGCSSFTLALGSDWNECICKADGLPWRGTFDLAPDVDLLIAECPPELRYAIEARVEDAMEGMPFHVIYLDEAKSENARQRLVRDAVDAPDSA